MNRKGWKGREVRLGRETTEGWVGGTEHGKCSGEGTGTWDYPALACIYLQARLFATCILPVFL